MARVVLGQFPPVVHPPAMPRPPTDRRILISQLMDDLKLLASERPAAFTIVAVLAMKFAIPIRRRLAEQALDEQQHAE